MKQVFIHLLLIMLAISLQAQDNLLDSANANMYQGDYISAIRDLTNHIEKNPQCSFGYLKRAKAYAYIGNLTMSNNDQAKANELSYLSTLYFNPSARANMLIKKTYGYGPFQHGNQFAKSPLMLNYYNTYLSEKILGSDDFLLINEILDALNYSDLNASMMLVDKIKDNSEFAYIYYDLKGIVELTNQQYAQAIESFTLSIQDNPVFPIAYHNRSIVYSIIGEVKKAKQDINKALALHDEIAMFHFTLAKLNEQENNTTQALQSYQEAIALDDAYGEALINQGILIKSQGNINESIKSLNLGIHNIDSDLEKAYHKGNLNFVQSEYKKAIAYYEDYLIKKPEDADALFNLGLSRILLKNIPEGCMNLEQSNILVPDNHKSEVILLLCNQRNETWRN